jgi:CelD/BcsL family acetyltransferase involved in cellulose biosynthesis
MIAPTEESRRPIDARDPVMSASAHLPAPGAASPAFAPAHGAAPGVQLHDSLEALAPARDDWNRAAAAAGSGLYGSFEWHRAWCDSYLEDRALRVFTVYDGTKLAAGAAVVVDKLPWRLGGLRLAKLAASDSVLTPCVPPAPAAYAGVLFPQILARLLDEGWCDALLLAPLPAESPLLHAARGVALSANREYTVLRDDAIDVMNVIDLPESFDAFLAALGKDERKSYRRRLNKLRDEHRAEIDVLRGPQLVLAEFDRFVELHNAQWRLRGKLGHFGDWPGAVDFHRRLIADAGDQVRLVRVGVDGRAIAHQYGFGVGDWFHAILLARSCDPRFDSYSLGTIVFFAAVEHAIAESKRRIDVGRGRYEYKGQHGAREVALRALLIVRNRGSSRARARMTRFLADRLHDLYYRLWFKNVAPRLPLPRRSLWKSWIRTRL